MSTENDLKRKLGKMLGASMLATTMSAIPANYDPTNLMLNGSYAFAEEGDSGSGEGGESDSDSNSGPGSGGESGESGDNSGPGSGDESGENSGPGSGGETGENSGPGSGGETGKNSGPGNSGSKNSGKNSRGGFFRNLFFGKKNGQKGKGRRANKRNYSRNVPARFGRVVRSRNTRRGSEVKYSDGWSEKVRDGRYQLVNPNGRVVVSRRARSSDRNRLKAAAKK